RHTRFSRDWSSDVCSSDLALHRAALERVQGVGLRDVTVEDFLVLYGPVAGIVGGLRRFGPNAVKTLAKRGTQSVDEAAGAASNKIGRASCRGRWKVTVTAR